MCSSRCQTRAETSRAGDREHLQTPSRWEDTLPALSCDPFFSRTGSVDISPGFSWWGRGCPGPSGPSRMCLGCGDQASHQALGLYRTSPVSGSTLVLFAQTASLRSALH